MRRGHDKRKKHEMLKAARFQPKNVIYLLIGKLKMGFFNLAPAVFKIDALISQ